MPVGRVSGHSNLGNLGPQSLGAAALRLAAKAGVKGKPQPKEELAKQDRAFGEAIKPSNVNRAVKQTRATKPKKMAKK